MEAIDINLSEWTLSGGGSQGESYNSNSDKGTMLKLFSPLIKPEQVISELEFSQAIYDLGISCPHPGRLAKYGDRYGIILQRIMNKKSFARAVGDEPARAEEFAERMAVMARDLHARPSEGTPFPSTIDYFRNVLKDNHTASAETLDLIGETIEKLAPYEKKNLVHGDFHFGNIITDGKKDYFIDLGAFSYGNPDFDNAMLYFTCYHVTEQMMQYEYHMHTPEARRFWEAYRKAYYGPSAPTTEELAGIFFPYIMVRTLFFEMSLGPSEALDAIRAMLRSKTWCYR